MQRNVEMFAETAMLIPQEATESGKLTPHAVLRLFCAHVYGRN